MPTPRKDLATHRLNGTRPEYVSDGVVVAPGRPKYPKGISAATRREFKRLCVLLEKRRSLTEGDGELLRLYAIAFDRHAEAIRKLAEEGTIKVYFRLDKHGLSVPSEKPNLWLRVAQDSEKQMAGYLRDLGLTPMTRSKVKAAETPKEAEPVDPNDKLLEPRTPTPVAADSLDDFEDIDLEAIN